MDTPKTGQQIGQYILESRLGVGGMAEVWRARNAVLGNAVAIKFLSSGFAGNAEVEQRFLGEGKRQANLQHPNIVSAFDFLYVEGRSFLVMKYIDGESLDHRLFKLQGPMTMPGILAISSDVLGALGYAHSEGVVHRDIKPSNILVENTGRAYVLDFGIALAMREQRVTRAGQAIGTPHYMSPEQIMGSKDLDHRSDIYSYGCVLYQMMTQTPPFDFKEGEGDTEYFVKDQHLRRPPTPPRQLNPGIPEHIEQVVMKCLEKKASDRFESCHALLAALNGVAPPVRRTQVGAAPMPTPTTIEAAAWGTAYPEASVYPGVPDRPRTVIEPYPSAMPYSGSTGTQIQQPYAAPGQQGSAAVPNVVPPVRKAGVPPMVLAAVGGVLALGAAGGGYFWYTNKPAEQKQTLVTPPQILDTSTLENRNTGGGLSGDHVTKDKPLEPVKPVRKTAPTTTAEHKMVKTATHQIPEPPPPADKTPILPPPPHPENNAGVLRCPGTPIPPNGQVTFRGLPNKTLHFEYDHTKWRPLITREGDHKNLTLVSQSPGYQTGCTVAWQAQ